MPVLVSALTDDVATLKQQTLQYQTEGIFPLGEKFIFTSWLYEQICTEQIVRDVEGSAFKL
jgi:hypothetical protein